MFRTVPLSVIGIFLMYAQQWYMSYRFGDSLRAGSGQNCSSVLSSVFFFCANLQRVFKLYHLTTPYAGV